MSTLLAKHDLSFLDSSGVALPSLPAVAMEVISLSQSEEVDLELIGDAVGKDPALAGRLLKLSNSPLFGRAQEVTNINQALMTLGLKAVKMAAISFSMVPALNRAQGGREEDFKAYWRRSVTGAVAAKQLLMKVGKRRIADEAFLCGLLMDTGFPTLLQSCAETYAPVLPSIDAGHASIEAEQEALGGACHADVAGHLLTSWGLPNLLIEPVICHHNPELLPEDASDDVRAIADVLNVAHDIATVVASERCRGEAFAEAKRKAMGSYELDEEEFAEFLEGLTDHVQAMAGLMDVDVGKPEDMIAMMMQAQEDMMAIAAGTKNELERSKTRVKELETRVDTDALTGISNRAAFDDLLRHHWDKRRDGQVTTPFSLIMVDVDHFKVFNDTYGHQAGDKVLQCVAQALEDNCRTREEDVVCRYGGEEFVVVVPNATLEDLDTVAERLRQAVETTIVDTDKGKLKVTASFGGCRVEEVTDGMDPKALLEAADKNLYAAKEAGRNCTVLTDFVY